MAAIDYGALLLVNGELINKYGSLYMKESDKGYSLKTAKDKKGVEYRLGGSVLAGDEKFFVTFNKTCFTIVSYGKVLLSEWGTKFKSETYYFEGLPDFKIRHLNEKMYPIYMDQLLPWEEFVRGYWPEANGSEKLSELENGLKVRKRYLKYLKKYARNHGILGWHYSQRYIASWEVEGDHYEVIFGYGVDPDESVWERIRDTAYDFSETEKAVINEKFETKKESA